MALSTGAIQRLYNNDVTPGSVLQLVDIKKISASGGGSSDRYRLVISDGQLYMQAMLATQLNEMVETGQVSPILLAQP